jgi:hypothetical protein
MNSIHKKNYVEQILFFLLLQTMTAVFRSCLPRFYSNTNQSISSEHLSTKTNSVISLDNEQCDENSMDYSSILTNQNMIKSTTNTPLLHLDSYSHNQLITEEKQSIKQTKLSRLKNPNTKKRGPPYSRINEKCQPLLTRLVGTIFGDQGFNDKQAHVVSNKKQRSKRSTRTSKKSILPSKSIIKKQFEDNEQTLRSLVTLLTQIESNVKLTTTNTPSIVITANENQEINPPIEKEQARNNNRMDDTYV